MKGNGLIVNLHIFKLRYIETLIFVLCVILLKDDYFIHNLQFIQNIQHGDRT